MNVRCFGLFASLLFSGLVAADGNVPGLPGLAVQPVTQPAVEQATEVELQTLGSLVEDARTTLTAQVVGASTAEVKPPPPVIQTAIGGSVTLAIARNQFNRIETPFQRASVRRRKDSPETIESDGRAIYIATPGTEQISLYVFDEAAPADAISLLLQPSGQIAPVNVRLDIGRPQSIIASLSRAEASEFERGEEYTAMLKALLRSLAIGEVPPGYGLSELTGPVPLMPSCWSPGLRVVPAQLLEGSNLIVIVARVDNPSTRALEFDESTCASTGVLAVSVWPDARVDAGGSTELYVVLERPRESSTAKRPSVLGAKP